MERQPYIAGVYRTEDKHTLGEGGSAQDSVHLIKWFVVCLDGMRYVIQPLSSQGLPTAMFTVVTADDFRKKYLPDPVTFQQDIVPHLTRLRDALARAESQSDLDLHGEIEQLYRSLMVAKFIRKSVLDDFALAKLLVESAPLTQGEFKVQVSRSISRQGVNLRKSKSYPEAVACYNSALEISPDDDHLYFNLARVQYEMDDLEGCRMSLLKALDLNPELYVATRFLNYLDGFI